MTKLRKFVVLTVVACASFSQAQTITPTVVATGLQGPFRVMLTPRGNLLVSEAGTENNAGRISMVSRGGNRTSLIVGLPSGKNEASGDFIGPTGLAYRDQTLYIVIANGDSDVAGTAPGSTIPNPKGIASALLSSVIAIRFSGDIDAQTGPFTLRPADHLPIADGNPVTISNGSGGTAEVTLVANFQDFTPNANTIYKHSDPYAITLDPNDSQYLYVVDAGQDAIVRINRETGRMRTVLRVPPIPSSVPGPPVSDPVPNAIVPYGNQFLVTQLTGFPFTPGASRVSLFDPSTATLTPFIASLSSAMDVIYIPRGDARPRFVVLEFTNNFLGTPPGPGRLLLYDSASGTPLVQGLPAPTSLAYDATTGEVFITDLTGRLTSVKLP